ncbi:MAG: sulfatase-like hydrolase/transferase [Deltaproteobacteria bacterium]|jgi:phosphoglycerol transferase|nr:sulfatase-like hydrolase/transferase [Deltaproteobacteria bacterium]
MSDNSHMLLSLLLLAVSIYIYRKTNAAVINRFIYSAIIFVYIIYSSFYGVSDYFTGDGINGAVVYHLKWGLNGAGFSEYWEIILTSIILIILGLYFSYWIYSKNTKDSSNKVGNICVSYLLISLSLLSNPASYDLYEILSLDSDASNFKSFYIKPHIRKVEDSRNLVFIYAESLERTYFDETRFPGLIKGLRQLESKSTYFTNIKQLEGTKYTIAGMVASQCGIPLFAPSHPNGMSSIDYFLPGATCLGDLLHNEGYRLLYYGGASLDFAGKGKFFYTHKFDEVYGKQELMPKLVDPDYKTGWGLFDDSLFDLAYKRFTELSESDENFVLFLLTLDTHHPKGHPSKSCNNIIYNDGSNPMLNAVACTDYLISKFINKIRQSPYSNNTVIVLASDHLAMRNTARNILKEGSRRNLFMILEPNKDSPTKIQKKGSTLDIGSTLLPFIGFKGTIGLGKDLMDNDHAMASEIEYIHNNIASFRSSITRFWGFPKVKNYIEIDFLSRNIKIDERAFGIPVLIEFNDELQAILRFPEPWNVEGLRLIDYANVLINNNAPFIWVDRCANVIQFDENFGQSGFCLLVGKGHVFFTKQKIYDNVRFEYDELNDIVNAPNR